MYSAMDCQSDDTDDEECDIHPKHICTEEQAMALTCLRPVPTLAFFKDVYKQIYRYPTTVDLWGCQLKVGQRELGINTGHRFFQFKVWENGKWSKRTRNWSGPRTRSVEQMLAREGAPEPATNAADEGGGGEGGGGEGGPSVEVLRDWA